MINPMRERAKEHFPTVLLTLLSIVQAIALELLWSHLLTASYLYQLSMTAVVGWLQISATLIGAMLIWVVYAGNVMRFRWVPAVSDSVYPFVVGIVQFWLVASLGPGSVGLWLVVMGVIVGLMTWVSQSTMRRARFDPDNATFFEDIPSATLEDFYPQISVVTAFVVVGLLIAFTTITPFIEALGVVLTTLYLSWLFYNSTQYWSASMAPRESS